MNKYKIKDISKINPSIDKSKHFSNSIVSFIPMAAISDVNYRIEHEIEGELSKYSKGYTSFEKGDILLAKITPCFENGKIAIADISHPIGFGSTEFYVVRVNPAMILTKYLFYILRSNTFLDLGKQNMTGSAGQKRLRRNFLENFEIPLPSMEEQKRIINILDKSQIISKKRKQTIEFLDNYLQSTFLEMFGDPVTNSKHWEVQPLKELLSKPTQNGLYVPKEDYKREGIEMVHMSDFFTGMVKRGSLKRVSIVEKDIKKYEVNSDDILIARRSLTYDGSAKPCRIPESSEPLVFESSLIKVTPNKDVIHPVYLYYYLLNERVRSNYVLKYVTSSTISGINQAGLNKISILVPKLEVQIKFSEIVKKQESIKKLMIVQSEKIDDQFQSLMQRSFNYV